MKKSLKILLAILIVPVILFTIFFITSHYGNPLTRITAHNKIKEYANKEFNDIEYTLDNVKYDPKFNLYYRKLNIPNSEDLDFFINYKDGEIFDEREMATSGTNTSNRIQSILNNPQYDQPVKDLFQYNLNFCFLTLIDEAWQNVKPDITIEDFFKDYKLKLSIYLNNPISNKEDMINKLKDEYKKLGITVERIEIAA